MNTRSFAHISIYLLVLFSLLLTSCAAPAARQTAEVVKTVAVKTEGETVVVTGQGRDVPAAPVAPAATEAPAALYAPLPTQAAAAAEQPLVPPMIAPGGAPVAAPLATSVPKMPLVPGLPTASPLPTALPILPPVQDGNYPHPENFKPAIEAPPPPIDNYFQNYGINPYEDAREDHLSTFSLDVDTASYSVARRYVMDGNLPPAGSVRVEEFVNYFEPGYPAPSNTAFALYADGSPSPFHSDGLIYLRVGVQGYEVSEAERKPASLTFVIDTSGSMDMENRLELVKQSLRLLVERLRPTDTVAIVAYGSQAYVVLNPTSGEEPGRIQEAIDMLYTTGSTNAEAGLRLGYQMAYQAYRPGAINRVILCSDGVANVGQTGPDAILNEIRGYVDTGITLTTVGFGMGNFNDVLMEQLADNGDGSYAYVDTLAEARKLFVDDLTSTLQVIARDAKIQVDFNPQVVGYYRLIGYENRDVADQDFRNDAVDAGELGAGHSAVALYALYLWPNTQGPLASIHLRWQDPNTFNVNEISGIFNTWDLSPSFESAPEHYQLAVTVAQYAEHLRQSPWSVGVSIGQVLQQATRISGLIPMDTEVAQFATLVSRASQIAVLR